MGDLKNTNRRVHNLIIGKGYSTRDERRQKRVAQEQTRKDKMFAGAELPDEEAIRRTERKKAAKRRGSRAETILTDQLG